MAVHQLCYSSCCLVGQVFHCFRSVCFFSAIRICTVSLLHKIEDGDHTGPSKITSQPTFIGESNSVQNCIPGALNSLFRSTFFTIAFTVSYCAYKCSTLAQDGVLLRNIERDDIPQSLVTFE